MKRAGSWWLLSMILACGAEGTSTSSPTPTSTSDERPRAPCRSDAECRLETVDGCGCIVVLASSPVGPGCVHPCFAYPCMDRVAACEDARCVVRRTPPPSEAIAPTPTPAPTQSPTPGVADPAVTP